ncbi:hypothetical protein EMWEY_00060340, partial [Eimeria maxima]
RGEEAADLVEALQPMPSPGAFPSVPSSIEPAEEATKSHAGLSGTMSEGTMHSGPLSSSEPLQSDSPRESLSQRAQLAIKDLFDSREWLQELLGRVPDQVLATCPFYRFPMKQLSLATFSMVIPEILAANMKDAVVVLSECMRLLKKTSLSLEETKALLGYTERLYGYATTTMPGARGGFAAIQTIDALGRVLFVLDTLHCAAEVLGEASN